MAESIITLPSASTTKVNHADVYHQRFIKVRVKMKEDLQKIFDEEVKKLYLNSELSKKWLTRKSVGKVVPMDDEYKLEGDLNEDIFLKAFITKYFPLFFYDWGMHFAPASVLATCTTASHVNYESKTDIINVGTKNQEEPEEGE